VGEAFGGPILDIPLSIVGIDQFKKRSIKGEKVRSPGAIKWAAENSDLVKKLIKYDPESKKNYLSDDPNKKREGHSARIDKAASALNPGLMRLIGALGGGNTTERQAARSIASLFAGLTVGPYEDRLKTQQQGNRITGRQTRLDNTAGKTSGDR